MSRTALSLLFLSGILFLAAPASGQASSRAKALLGEGSALYQEGHFAEAKAVFYECLSLFTEDSGRMSSQLWLGAASFQLAEYTEAEEAYLKALDLALILEDSVSQSHIATALANMYNTLGEYPAAADWYMRSGDYAERGGNAEASASSRIYGVYIYLFVVKDLLQLNKLEEMGRYITLIGNAAPGTDLSDLKAGLLETADLLNNRGAGYYESDNYTEALTLYGQALTLTDRWPREGKRAVYRHNQAQSLAALGQYDQALEAYEAALDLVSVEQPLRADIFNSLGELHRAWGLYETSISCYVQAIGLFSQAGDDEGLASAYNNRGLSLFQAGHAETSLEWFDKSIELAESLGHTDLLAIALSQKGNACRELGQTGEAERLYEQALVLDRENGNLRGVHLRINNLALILVERGRYREALPLFEESLAYVRSISDTRSSALILNNLGYAHFSLGDYEASLGCYKESVALFETLRSSAAGAVRREFLESEIQTYRDLAQVYFHNGRPADSLVAMELSKSAFLLEEMRPPDTAPGKTLQNPSDNTFTREKLGRFVDLLGQKTGLVSLNIVNPEEIQISLMRGGEIMTWLSPVDRQKISSLYTTHERIIERVVSDRSDNQMGDLIRFYRHLLARLGLNSRYTRARDDLARWLYDITFSLLQDHLEGLETLIIITDGILGYVPFETLRSPGGRYLIQDFDMGYAPSLAVVLEAHDRRYPASRRPMLAFGGADYSEQEGWDDLPGSLDEVSRLAQIIPQARIRTGQDVSEAVIRGMSENGILDDFEVLHFAVHGLADPAEPAESALVLSDGRLTMNEIAALNIRADFVNLSACETGLGKVYRGEGIVGLTQAFLIAGAKSLSVSLWKVSDRATGEFMTGLYEKAGSGMTWLQALSEMKRNFISSELYSSSFYWAPFVYYGDF